LFAEVVKTARMAFVEVGRVGNTDAAVFGAKNVLTLAYPCALFDKVEFAIARKTAGFGTARRKTTRAKIGSIH
jgi:hypothetical protein